tara:strand:- start:2685 stop:3269 length:585 start_codon:yes stop_codon:yes gene_type:complete
METNKILSFEEFSATTTTATTDTATTTDATVDTDTVDTDTTTDTETTDTETTDTEDTTNTEEETEETEEEVTEEGEEITEEPKTVAEMMTELKDAMVKEAKVWEEDAHDNHTAESYLKENAALAATMAATALEEMNKEDESYTKESYEASCEVLKEAYCKKIDSCKEAYESEGTVDNSEVSDDEKEAIIAEPVK